MIAALILWAPLSAVTQAEAPDRGRRALDGVVACRQIAEGQQRLACFDREAAALDVAVRSRKVVVLDQEQVKRTRRSLFGFSLPSLNIFGGGDGKREETPELTRVETVVTSSSRMSDGRIAFAVEDGAHWVQDDDRTLMLARIKAGTKVRISRGALGSYFASFAGGGSARVRRDR